jgi:hypothetical protein
MKQAYTVKCIWNNTFTLEFISDFSFSLQWLWKALSGEMLRGVVLKNSQTFRRNILSLSSVSKKAVSKVQVASWVTAFGLHWLHIRVELLLEIIYVRDIFPSYYPPTDSWIILCYNGTGNIRSNEVGKSDKMFAMGNISNLYSRNIRCKSRLEHHYTESVLPWSF